MSVLKNSVFRFCECGSDVAQLLIDFCLTRSFSAFTQWSGEKKVDRMFHLLLLLFSLAFCSHIFISACLSRSVTIDSVFKICADKINSNLKVATDAVQLLIGLLDSGDRLGGGCYYYYCCYYCYYYYHRYGT